MALNIERGLLWGVKRQNGEFAFVADQRYVLNLALLSFYFSSRALEIGLRRHGQANGGLWKVVQRQRIHELVLEFRMSHTAQAPFRSVCSCSQVLGGVCQLFFRKILLTKSFCFKSWKWRWFHCLLHWMEVSQSIHLKWLCQYLLCLEGCLPNVRTIKCKP